MSMRNTPYARLSLNFRMKRTTREQDKLSSKNRDASSSTWVKYNCSVCVCGGGEGAVCVCVGGSVCVCVCEYSTTFLIMVLAIILQMSTIAIHTLHTHYTHTTHTIHTTHTLHTLHTLYTHYTHTKPNHNIACVLVLSP